MIGGPAEPKTMLRVSGYVVVLESILTPVP